MADAARERFRLYFASSAGTIELSGCVKETVLSSHRPQFVDDELFERQLNRIRPAEGDPNLGVFGPDSLTWKVDREAVLFMGAGRATLLQTAHPWVAAAIDQLSTTKQDPIGRFHRTFTMMYAMVFGTMDQALVKARALHAIHKQIKGTIKEETGPFEAGSQYFAGDVDAMLWVFATLLDTSSRMYQLVFPPLSDDDKRRLYDEQRTFAYLFWPAGPSVTADLEGLRRVQRRHVALGGVVDRPRGT